MLFPLIPWVPLLQKHFDELGASEISAMVGNPELIQIHLTLHRLFGQQGANAATGNGNGTTPAQAPSGLLPAQTFGGPLQ